MSKTFPAGVLILLVSIASFGSASACGDKFLVPGQVPGFDRAYAAPDPGHLLLYRSATSDVAREVMTDEFKEMLRRVGHVVDVVDEPAELERARRSNAYDIVLVDATEIEELRSDGDAILLPVLYEASWMEVVRLKEAYGLVINAPSRASQLLSVVEEAIELRRTED